ncbi:hypothetical protein DRQ25_00355 [Candidatus Fermentibacteria bacterium]|nr:MAG: hypothetical protein DRQ25_00355 [Candidatus Fermentibacteria bacterium]
MDATDVFYSGVECSEEEGRCEVYWLITQPGGVVEATLEIPIEDVGGDAIEKDEILEDMLHNSKIGISTQ